MQKLKQKLLDTGDFKDCEALDKYCNLVVINQSRNNFPGETQIHHILPRAWFKLYNKKLDNSDTNKVTLLVSDHAKAHLFLFQAAINPEVRSHNAAAVRYMCDLFSEELIDLAAEDLNRINEEVSKAKSKALAERRAAGLNERRRAVVCIETGQVFNTIKEAEETLHVFIKEVLKGKKSHAGGYHFKYEGEDPPQFKPKLARFTAEELEILKREYYEHGTNIPALLSRHTSETIRCKACSLKLVQKHSNKRSVICIETKVKYPTITAAAQTFGIDASNICYACKSGGCCGGYHWEYAKEA